MHYSGRWAMGWRSPPTFRSALTLYGPRCKCFCWHIWCAQSSKLFTASNFFRLCVESPVVIVVAIAWSPKLFGEGDLQLVFGIEGERTEQNIIMKSLSRHVTHKRSDHLGTVCGHTRSRTHSRTHEHTRQIQAKAETHTKQTESKQNTVSYE